MIKKINFKTKKFFILPAACLLLVAIFWQTISYGRTLPSLTVANFPLGGIKNDSVKEIMENQLKKFNNERVTLTYQNKTWQFTPEEFGLRIDLETTLAQINSLGHGTNPLAAAAEWLESFFYGKQLPLNYSFDFPKFKKTLAVLTSVEKPPRDAILKYNQQTGDFEIVAAKKGMLINRERLVAGILNNFAAPDSQTIYLETNEVEPTIKTESLAAPKEIAENLIAEAPYFLQSPDSTWQIEKQELADWILTVASPTNPDETKISLNQDKIKEFLSSITFLINREPVNGRLGWKDQKLIFAVTPQNGQKLDLEQSADKIKNAILAGEKRIALVIETIEPQISRESVEELGFLSLLGRGESNFSGSPQNRKHNLELGASKLNGIIIKPGEEFSFAQSIGTIDGQAGYLPELVIKNKQTIPEYGGGMCQVSTTLFRAAVNSGLKITERHPHAYSVHYYDPPGFDATIYPPSPDLKFVNDTSANILLQSRAEKTKLFFEIYGTADGREVKIKGPVTTQANPDGSLKTILTQEIWRQGQLERSDVFYSNYKSPALFPIASPAPAPNL